MQINKEAHDMKTHKNQLFHSKYLFTLCYYTVNATLLECHDADYMLNLHERIVTKGLQH